MSTSEEKIKAFFSDEEKVKALTSDREFIEKVSGGTATTETYTEEFKKLGLELSNAECEKVKKSVSEILTTPIEKLEADSLENVSGGFSKKVDTALIKGGLITAGVGALGSVACTIAGTVYGSKAYKAALEGDTKNADKYANIENKLHVLSAAIWGTVVTGGAGAAVIGTFDRAGILKH